jgi:DNA polymerase V
MSSIPALAPTPAHADSTLPDLSTPVALLDADPAWTQRVLACVQAGFPSPAEDHAIERVDLNKVLIKHPQATFLMRVRGASMREAGIDDGDVVLVDRAIKAVHGHVVVAVVDGEFTVKRLSKRGSNLKLQAANPTYPDIVPRDGQTVEVWGVVTTAIKAMCV